MSLVAGAQLFLRAGGRLSLDDWHDMSEAERAAFVAAGDAMREERTQALRTVLAEQEWAKAVAHDNEVLSAALDEAVRRAP